MTPPDWLAQGVSMLRPAAKARSGPRSTQERLKATLRHEEEAMSPRLLRQSLKDLKAIVDPMVSEVEGGRRAQAMMDWYAAASPPQRRDLWLLMSERFVADPQHVKKAQAQFAAAVGTPDEAAWFDVGFLDLRRITWDSPASLVEKLIKYEAVHDIRSWADVKNRLDSDRRCYGFFHPRLPGEPLIFVEVALMNEIAASITPLLDEAAAPADLARATTAIFYSISNTQTGLKGVSFGDSLIKRVVESLKQEFPHLRHFATLSPIPGLRAWLSKNAPPELLKAWEHADELPEAAPERRALLGWAARYLGMELHDGKPLDPVARFHLGNGARVERLNWAADPSAKGIKQSHGLMVNYLYDLKRLDKHRTLLAQGKIPIAAAIKDLYL
jgi:malonyl-CoA decarboxylase